MLIKIKEFERPKRSDKLLVADYILNHFHIEANCETNSLPPPGVCQFAPFEAMETLLATEGMLLLLFLGLWIRVGLRLSINNG